MNTAQGLLLVAAIFAAGVAALAILFFGGRKDQARRFSRHAGKGKGADVGQLAGWVIGLAGLAVFFISLTGLVPPLPTIAIGAGMALVGFGSVIPDRNGPNASRGFLVIAWLALAGSLACLGGLIVLGLQATDRYSIALLFLPMMFLAWGWLGFGAAAVGNYLRYVADKPLPTIEPPPEVLAKLLEPGPAPAPPPAPPAPPVAAKAPPPPALPGLLAGVVCLSAGMWFRTTELLSTEVGYVVGVPLFVYGVIRSGLSLLALARSARRI